MPSPVHDDDVDRHAEPAQLAAQPDGLGKGILDSRLDHEDVERGLTQEQVADAGGLALSEVGRIERGQRDPGVRVLVRLAKGLSVSLAELLNGVD